MSRTLVKTTTAGWYIDASDPDGARVRKNPDDTIIDRDQFEGQQDGDSAVEQIKQQDKTAERSVVVSDTGKLLKSTTTTIKCQWVDEDKRNPQIDALLDTDPRKVTLEQITEAGGDPCGDERVINVQDEFQVRYCSNHQKEHRRRRRRQKMALKRKAEKD